MIYYGEREVYVHFVVRCLCKLHIYARSLRKIHMKGLNFLVLFTYDVLGYILRVCLSPLRGRICRLHLGGNLGCNIFAAGVKKRVLSM